MNIEQMKAIIDMIGTGAALVHPAAGAAVTLAEAGLNVFARIAAEQEKRKAEGGRELTSEEVGALMAAGDVQEELGRAHIAQALLAQQAAMAAGGGGGSTG